MPVLLRSALFLAVSFPVRALPIRIYSVLFPSGSLRFSALPVRLSSTHCSSVSLLFSWLHFQFKSPPFLSDHFVSSSSRLSATLFQINSNLLHLKAVRSLSIPFRFFPHQCVSAPAHVRSVPLHSFSILIVSVRRVSVSTRNFSCLFRFHSGRVYSLPIRLASNQFRSRSGRFYSLPVHLGAMQRLSMPAPIVSMHFKSESNRIVSDQCQFQEAPRIANSYLFIS